MLRTIIFFSCISALCLAFEVPCTEKLVGGSCQIDEECYGDSTICLEGRCSCPTNFEAYTTDDSPPRTFCRPAPDALNAACQTDCKPPYTCRDGKCDCWGSGSEYVNGVCKIKCPAGTQQYGAECRKVSRFNELCTDDIDCVDPFTECSRRRCSCTQGTRNYWGKCQPQCPDGTAPKGSCRRLFTNDVDMLEHKADGDTCASDHYCATYGKPNVGHCCPMYCPYGEPDLDKSCDASASGGDACRKLTHFCHRIKAPGYSKSICCPRPCREPTPLYLNGKCMSNAHYNDLCSLDEQCEGGVGMVCDKASSRCTCKAGFAVVAGDRFSTCKRACASGQVEVAGRCLPRVSAGQRCYSDAQCMRCGRCYNGVCECKCGYQLRSGLGGVTSCVNPSAQSSSGGFDLSNLFQQGGLAGLFSGAAGGGASSAASCDTLIF